MREGSFSVLVLITHTTTDLSASLSIHLPCPCRHHAAQLKRYTYGKHILVRLEKISGEKFV